MASRRPRRRPTTASSWASRRTGTSSRSTPSCSTSRAPATTAWLVGALGRRVRAAQVPLPEPDDGVGPRDERGRGRLDPRVGRAAALARAAGPRALAPGSRSPTRSRYVALSFCLGGFCAEARRDERATVGVLLAAARHARLARAPRDVRRYLREFLSDPRVIDLPGARALAARERGHRCRSARRAPRARIARSGRRTARRCACTPTRSPSGAREGARRGLPRSRSACATARRRSTDALERLVRAGRAAHRRAPALPAARRVVARHARSRAVERGPRSAPSAPELAHPAALLRGAGLRRRSRRGGAPGARRAAARPRADELPRPARAPRARRPTRRASTASRGADCCDAARRHATSCYRAQCFATSRARGARARRSRPSASRRRFQSRLGRARWIGPSTDDLLISLAGAGCAGSPCCARPSWRTASRRSRRSASAGARAGASCTGRPLRSRPASTRRRPSWSSWRSRCGRPPRRGARNPARERTVRGAFATDPGAP